MPWKTGQRTIGDVLRYPEAGWIKLRLGTLSSRGSLQATTQHQITFARIKGEGTCLVSNVGVISGGCCWQCFEIILEGIYKGLDEREREQRVD